jgi:hypothetical protein
MDATTIVDVSTRNALQSLRAEIHSVFLHIHSLCCSLSYTPALRGMEAWPVFVENIAGILRNEAFEVAISTIEYTY